MSTDLVKRSVKAVKERAETQRKSPERLSQVESIVAANVEVREKIHRSQIKQAKTDEKYNTATFT